MSRHQGWFAYFSAGPVGRQAWQKEVQRKSLENGWEFTFSDTIVMLKGEWPEMSGPQR